MVELGSRIFHSAINIFLSFLFSTFYVLTCTTDRSTKEYPELTSKAMHDFKPKEIEYIKVLMNKILQSEDKEITITSAINSTMVRGYQRFLVKGARFFRLNLAAGSL